MKYNVISYTCITLVPKFFIQESSHPIHLPFQYCRKETRHRNPLKGTVGRWTRDRGDQSPTRGLGLEADWIVLRFLQIILLQYVC